MLFPSCMLFKFISALDKSLGWPIILQWMYNNLPFLKYTVVKNIASFCLLLCRMFSMLVQVSIAYVCVKLVFFCLSKIWIYNIIIFYIWREREQEKFGALSRNPSSEKWKRKKRMFSQIPGNEFGWELHSILMKIYNLEKQKIT